MSRQSDAHLVRISAEDRNQVETDINGTRYYQHDGYFHMKPADAALHRESANLPTPSAAGPVGRRAGYRCTECGFGSFFTTCGRCKGVCEREG